MQKACSSSRRKGSPPPSSKRHIQVNCLHWLKTKIHYTYSHSLLRGRLIKYFRAQLTYTLFKHLRNVNYILDCKYVTATMLHNVNINMPDVNQSRDQHNCNFKKYTNNACAYHRLLEIDTEYIETKSCLYCNF